MFQVLITSTFLNYSSPFLYPSNKQESFVFLSHRDKLSNKRPEDLCSTLGYTSEKSYNRTKQLSSAFRFSIAEHNYMDREYSFQ